MAKDVNCSREDAETQIKLFFDSLPLASRNFATDTMAKMLADDLVCMTENQKRIQKSKKGGR